MTQHDDCAYEERVVMLATREGVAKLGQYVYEEAATEQKKNEMDRATGLTVEEDRKGLQSAGGDLKERRGRR